MSDPGTCGGQCPMHYLPLPCTACQAEKTWAPNGFMTAKTNPLGPNYHPEFDPKNEAYSVSLREQVARIQESAHKLQVEGENPDCVIVWSRSPLGQLTNARIATVCGDLKVIPDPCCPPTGEVVGLESELAPKTAPKPTHRDRARAWLNDGPFPLDFESTARRLAAAFAEVEAEAKREAMASKRLDVVSDALSLAPTTGASGCAECGKAPCETFIACEMDAWKRSVTARMASTVMPSVATDPELYRKRFPIISVPYAKACTCGAVTTYGAENARQGSPVHARGCEMA